MPKPLFATVFATKIGVFANLGYNAVHQNGASNMAKIGRKQKHHQSETEGTIVGLTRQPDGRWRIIEGPKAGFRFTEPDEARAIAKFRQLTTGQTPMVWIGDAPAKSQLQVTDQDTAAAGAINVDLAGRSGLPEDFIYPIMRELLLADPAKCARLCGIPALTNLLHMDTPKDAISIDALTAAYELFSPSKSKARTVEIFKQMARRTQVKLLAELTVEKLGDYRMHIEGGSTNGGAKAWKYGQIKAVLSFGLKAGLDPIQIRAALDRAKILWTSDKAPDPKPNPISREDFHKLLAASTQANNWRAWLLAGLNLCLHMGEVIAMKWDTIDLESGTHAAIREKTKTVRAGRPLA